MVLQIKTMIDGKSDSVNENTGPDSPNVHRDVQNARPFAGGSHASHD
jgi:hypothetical protein